MKARVIKKNFKVQPVDAYALVDEGGRIILSSIRMTKTEAESHSAVLVHSSVLKAVFVTIKGRKEK